MEGRASDAGRDALSSAFRLLCASIRWPPSDATAAAIDVALPSITDWQAFLHLTSRHRVEGLVAATLDQAGWPVPDGVRTALSEAAKRIARDNLAMAAALRGALNAFDREGIEAVVLKGVPLTMLLFGSLSVRHAKDIDILVQPDTFDRAAAIVGRLGYARVLPPADANPRFVRIWRRVWKDQTFRRAGVEIELHWQATNNPFLLSIPWQPSDWQTVRLGRGNEVRTLAGADLFAYLAAHGAITQWHRLKWLADIAALLADQKAGAIEAMFERATALGAGRPAGQALLLCADLLDCSLPNDLLARLRSDRAIVGLVEIARSGLVRDGAAERTAFAFGTLRTSMSRMNLSPSIGYKLREIAVNFANPLDAAGFSMRGWLAYAYPAFRLFAWLRTQLTNRARRGAKRTDARVD